MLNIEREEKGISIIRDQLRLNINHAVILDPTLLIPKDEWIERLQLISYKRRKPYILLYILDYAFDPYPNILEVAQHFSKKLNLPVKVITGNKKWLINYFNTTKTA